MMRGITGTTLSMLLSAGWAAAQAPPPSQLSAEDAQLLQGMLALMNTPVVSASKMAEKLSDAPATVIVISREDLDKRGYTQLSEILDDLPGMEIVRPYGDTQLKNYWRGYRNTIGEPFLVMIDGVVFNHLYFNTADTPLVATPLSNIDHVEVVYGPASSVYGANAFMGVINIITVKDRPEDGSFQRVKMTGGSMGLRVLDANYFFKKGEFRFSASVRVDNGFVDNKTSENYEFTKNSYYADRRMWGGFVDNPSLGGKFESGWRHRALDLRAYLGNTEFGFQYQVADSGYGVEYPGDLVQNNAVWARPDLSFHLRHTEVLSEDVTSTTLIRYRESGLRPDSYFVDGYDNGAPDGYVAAYSYWQTINSSWSLFQDFDLRLTPSISLTAGFKYERKDLQKAYDISGENLDPVTGGNPYRGILGDSSQMPGWAYGAYIPVRNFYSNLGLYPFPEKPQPLPGFNNRIATEDRGLFAQAKWRMDDHSQFNLGLRSDHNSVYGGNTTVRGGYVGNFGAWGFKALYGQAYQEPAPRVLYGGWSGSGADPSLSPEKSNTLEMSASYTNQRFSSLLSLWQVKDSDTIITQKAGTDNGKGALNLGKRDVRGADLHGQVLLPSGDFKQVKLWGYYSHYFRTDEEKFQFDKAAGVFDHLGTGEIGDLAKNKLWAGFTLVFNDQFDFTLRGRYMGERRAVDTNVRNDLPGSPVTVVPSYGTLDANVNLKWRKVGIALKVDNLLDKQYSHPGIRDASAGFVPGTFGTDNLTYSGGSGYHYYNSLLPQPGRSFKLSLNLTF